MLFVNARWNYTAMAKLQIEVAYATAERQHIIPLEVEADCTIEMAIRASGMLALYPEINLAHQPVGVFSKSRQLADKVQHGDRIEIYRPLIIDPKEARRAKAKKTAKKS
jgi:putative ubiquitin-RnfH superfamily antitoxin RatB of RatAB toxin-antitoxin module